MAVKRIENRGSFLAFDDEGNEYVIHQFVKILDASSMDNPGGEVQGLKSLRTAQGQAVNYVEKGQYILAVTGKALYSDDEKAP